MRWPDFRMAISASISRFFTCRPRMVSSARLISSSIALNASRHSASGRALLSSPRPSGASVAKRRAKSLRTLAAEILSSSEAALVLQRLQLLLALGRALHRLRRGRPRVDRADLHAGAALAFHPERCRVEAQRKIARQHHVLAGGQVDLQHAGHGRAVRIDRHRVDCRRGFDVVGRRGHDGAHNSQKRQKNAQGSLPSEVNGEGVSAEVWIRVTAVWRFTGSHLSHELHRRFMALWRRGSVTPSPYAEL